MTEFSFLADTLHTVPSQRCLLKSDGLRILECFKTTWPP